MNDNLGMGSKSLSGKLAVVTGADSGIGLCFSHELATRGCELVMVSNRPETLTAAAADINRRHGVKAHAIAIDLCRADATGIILNALNSRELNPDILINNAGMFSFMPVVDLHPQKINAFIDLHIRAVTELSRAFARHFKQRGSGYILNMSSMSCWMPMPGLSMYSATKSYIRVFTRSLHYEMRDYGVKVTVACPGGIATDLFGLPPGLMKLAVRLHAVQRPERFVKCAIDKMLKGKKQYINGGLNRLAIFFIAILPTRIRMLIKHLMLDKGITR